VLLVNNYTHIYRNTQHTTYHSCVLLADVRPDTTLDIIWHAAWGSKCNSKFYTVRLRPKF